MNREYDPPTVMGIFIAQAKRFGDKTLKVHKQDGEWTPMSYTGALEGVIETSLGLQSLGVKKGDTVGIVSDTRVEWNDADFGVLCAGAVVVGIYPTNTVDQVEYLVSHSECAVVFSENAAQTGKLLQVRANTGLPKTIVQFEVEGALDPDTISLEELKAKGARLRSEEPDRFDASVRAVGHDDLATIAYTSGTTGPPKGVMITHGNLYFTAINSASVMEYGEDDFGVVFLPLTHLLQRLSIYAGLHLGVRGAYAESIDKLVDNMQELRPTVQVAVPRIFEKMYTRIWQQVQAGPPIRQKIFSWAIDVGLRAASYRKEGKAMPPALAAQRAVADKLVYRKIRAVLGGNIKYFISGGAPISVGLLDFFYAIGLLILEGYGLTETVAPATVNRRSDFRFGTVGKPIPGMEAAVAGDGEILLRGKGLFIGYYKDEAATTEAIDTDGWFHTGDIGEIDAEGFLKITDRKKEIIVTAGGKNVAPQNIENLLKGSPLISNAMVAGDRKKYLTALIALDEEELAAEAKKLGIETEPGADLAQDDRIRAEVQKHVEQVNARLARYETIKRFEIVEKDFSEQDGTLTPTLKLRRKPIAERYKSLIDSMYDETFD